MKKLLLCFCFATFLLSCNNDKDKEKTDTPGTTMDAGTKSTVDLPYKASYSSSWSTDVSDADLKTVLMTYKDWADGNISGLGKAMGDTVTVDMSSGDHLVKTNADLTKMWSTYRDSLSSVKIDMTTWQKMYSTDKKESYIVTWYDETDTYKTGKVDSASYHDINQVKNGKITWYAQYKRPKK
jgi:ketosteroid isomerase-like protein